MAPQLARVAETIVPSLTVTPRLDWSAALGIIFLSALLGGMTGVLPAWWGARQNPASILGGSRGSIGASKNGRLAREVFLGGQTAAAVTLVVLCALLAVSGRNLAAIDTGMSVRNQELLQSRWARDPVTRDPVTNRALPKVLQEIRAIAGVEAVTAAGTVPLGRRRLMRQVDFRDGRPPASIRYNTISADYFRTIGASLVAGRTIDDRDTFERPRVAVVNETLANRYWPGERAVGRFLNVVRRGDTQLLYEVVGVVRDGKYGALTEDAQPFYFVPMAQEPAAEEVLLLVAPDATRVGEVLAGVRAALVRHQDVVTIGAAGALADHVARQTARLRLAAALSTVAAAVALFLIVMGTASVAAYSAARRRGEMAVRMALGATPGEVVALMLRSHSPALVCGLVVGGPMSVAVGRLLGALLFGVQPADPFVLAVVVVVVGATTMASLLLPARSAATLEIAAILRSE